MLLLDSQLAYLSQLTNHQRKKDFLEIRRLNNGDLTWQFGDEEERHSEEYAVDGNLHPVLGILCDNLSTYNQKHGISPQQVKAKPVDETVYRFVMPAKTWKQRVVTPYSKR